MIEIQGDFHGHSRYSDGASNVSEIVEYGLKRGLGIIGISDHKDIRASGELIQLAERHNFIPCVGTELKVKIPRAKNPCHVVVAQFGELITRKYLSDLDRAIKRDNTFENMLAMVKDHNALLLFTHPGVVGGVPFTALKCLCKNLEEESKPYLAVETKNWMVKMFVGLEPIYSHLAYVIAQKHSLTKIGSSDYHFGKHIGNQSTIFPLEKINGEGVIHTLRQGKVYPSVGSKMSLSTLMQLGVFVTKDIVCGK